MMRKIFSVLFALVLALGLSLVTATPVYAVHALTPGASVDIDADTNGGAYTSLNNIAFTDPGPDLAATNTFFLTAPTGFEFNNAVGTAIGTGYAGGLIIDLGAGAGSAASPVYSLSDTIATWTVTAAGTVGSGTITISGMEIRPTAAKTTIDGDGTANVTIAGNVTTFDSPNAHPIDHVPGALNNFLVEAQGGGNIGTQTAGAAFLIQITAWDQHNNTLNDGVNFFDGAGNTVEITSNVAISAGGGTSGVFTAGVLNNHSMTLTETSDAATITATDSAGGLGSGTETDTSNAFTINPGALTSFTIIGTPAGVFAGAAFPSPITVTAYDAYANVKTDYVETVTWSSSASAALPADYTFVGGDNGVRIFPGSEFILFSAGTHTITVTDGLVSAPSSGITVMPVDVAPLPDTTPPVVSDISASNITETSADICWKTNERSTSQVEYWSSPGTLSSLDETMVIDHLVHLTDLTPGADYHYKTMSKDRAGNLAVSDVESFTTSGEAPAAVFSASDLSISPSEVNIGEMVTISVLVANTGNAAGDYEVTLKINDVAEATKEVTLDAGASTEVTFTTSKDKAATYSVDVNGLSGSFTVKEEVAPAPPAPPPPAPPPEVKAPINWPLIGGIIAAVVIVGVVGLFLIRRPRRIS